MLTVTLEENTKINQVASSATAHPYIKRRALILQQLINTNLSTVQIATKLGVPSDSVHKLQKRYLETRLAVLEGNAKLPAIVAKPVPTVPTRKLPSRSLSSYITKHKKQ